MEDRQKEISKEISATNAAPSQSESSRINRVQPDTIDLIDLCRFFLGHIQGIIICVLVGAIIAFLYTYFMVTPMYDATAKMYIVSASNDSVVNLADLQIGSNLTSDYKQLITSKTLITELIRKTKIDTTYDRLKTCITVTNPSDTRIIAITVRYDDPVTASGLANGLAELAQAYLPQVMKCEEPSVYEQADAPLKKSSPSISRNTLMGAFLLAALYLGYLTMIYLLDDSLKGPEDVSKWLGSTPLAIIPDMEDTKHRKYGRYGGYYGYSGKNNRTRGRDVDE